MQLSQLETSSLHSPFCNPFPCRITIEMHKSDEGSHGSAYQALTEVDLISSRNLSKLLTFLSGKNLATEFWVIIKAAEKTNFLVKKKEISLTLVFFQYPFQKMNHYKIFSAKKCKLQSVTCQQLGQALYSHEHWIKQTPFFSSIKNGPELCVK